MLGSKTDALKLVGCKTKKLNPWLSPVCVLAAGFLFNGCVMTRAEGELISLKVDQLETEMARMQNMRHDMKILLEGQKKTIDRLVELERQLPSLRESLVDGHSKSFELISEIQNLRNELEEAQNRYKLLEEDQKNLAKNQQALKEEQKKRKIPAKLEEHFLQAKKYYDENKTDDAIFLLERFVELYPKNTKFSDQAFFLLGSSFKKNAENTDGEEKIIFYKKSAVNFQALLSDSFKKSPIKDEALFQLGWVLKSMDNNQGAKAAFKELLLKHKDSKRLSEAKAILNELEKSN
jgi:TolA-binding protein